MKIKEPSVRSSGRHPLPTSQGPLAAPKSDEGGSIIHNPSSIIPAPRQPRYSIRRHTYFWSLTFNGQEACFDHAQGAYFVAYPHPRHGPGSQKHGLLWSVIQMVRTASDTPFGSRNFPQISKYWPKLLDCKGVASKLNTEN